ncbi:hypothetical protein LEP1GSC038_2145 [Leptospira weilii str. 2006001855]|uniref:Uncharacterized protein n=2 Tax=Leptospira weilii TaxID=28184 RepID=M6Q7B0_9LEPT|nr:hypothetical protein LEP1GSC038_2145 [Leptospira weilii str. 2006001855]EMN89045.1 hypothetical protein LEP1GSC108_3754 [Leptospira weilii str. UI 13098]QDK22213.1 hypothetical protein FHG67_05310 [Leptospira weilii]
MSIGAFHLNPKESFTIGKPQSSEFQRDSKISDRRRFSGTGIPTRIRLECRIFSRPKEWTKRIYSQKKEFNC